MLRDARQDAICVITGSALAGCAAPWSLPSRCASRFLAWSYDTLPSTTPSLEIAGKTAYTPGVDRPTMMLVDVGCVDDGRDDDAPGDIYAAFESAPFRDRALRVVDRAPTTLADLYAASAAFMPPEMRYAVDGVRTSAGADEILDAGREILDTVPSPMSFMSWMLWRHHPTRDAACWSTRG